MSVKKAVFPVAGLGTRFLPATKALPKELLPIVDKPLVQYAAEEAIQAGINTLVFVTGRNKRAIEDHFDSNPELEKALFDKGKKELAIRVREIVPSGVECIFVRQPIQLGLGHAVMCAERAIGNEPFAVLLSDIFLTDQAPNATADLISGFEQSGKSQLSVMPVNGAEISNYGVVIPGRERNAIKGLVEKPSLECAPSNLASIGRYVFTTGIFDHLRQVIPGVGDEIQLADAINSYAELGLMEAVSFNGRCFDCGGMDGFVQANVYEYSKRKD